MKISFITTIYNEETTITKFLKSLVSQTKVPDEVVIVDGGSVDQTVYLIKNFQFPKSIKKVKIIIHKGNRSMGRNTAIKEASGEIIVCSDAGNILEKNWLKNISEPFIEKHIDVVAGYYKGMAKNAFQKSLLPYVLVMPDKVNPKSFLPATRSVAFKKSIWEKVGGFDEALSHNEDYAFAKKLKKIGANIVFARNAIVYWMPRNTLKQTYTMFLRFAYGDAEANIFRPKVLFLFIRYFICMLLVLLFIITKSFFMLFSLLLIIMLYIGWAISKNYRYVMHTSAFYYLPLLQFIADFAVMNGTISGILHLWDTKKML
ncbi:MAG: glycosyltransferase [Candidatus Levybacteria bacterium]|nr:glycosyltransferase [Candidatus Levybacteria bacterium]